MTKTTTLLIAFLSIYYLLLAACTPVASPTSDEPGSSGEATSPPDGPTVEPAGPYSVAWLAGLPPEIVLLQQDFEPTFFRPEARYPFGRFPIFTLFADGSLVYVNAGQTVAQQRIEIVQLSSEETIALIEQVIELGFENLEDSLDDCLEEEDGNMFCVADASFTILRAVVPSGELREVKTYYNFSNDPEAFAAVTDLFLTYEHPDAGAYVPTQATVFARLLTIDLEMPVQEWPLDIELLKNLTPGEHGLDAFILEGETLNRFLSVFPVSVNNYFFEVQGQTVEVYFVPWPPHVEYMDQIEAAFP